jgi:hypothetical protein
MNTADVEIPIADKLIDITGTPDSMVNNIQFEGITFTHTNYTHPSYYGDIYWQANQYVDTWSDKTTGNEKAPTGAIELKYAAHINIERCRFNQLGSQGINLFLGSQYNLIRGCSFVELAGIGVQFGNMNTSSSDYWNPFDSRKLVKNNTVNNCYFDTCASEYLGGMAVLVAWTEGTTITHNEMCNLPYTGLSTGWGWSYANIQPNCVKNTVINYNYIHDFMTTLDDGGGIYTLGPQSAGTGECAYNHIKNMVHAYSGIYLDEGSSNWTDYNNVVEYVSTYWMHIGAPTGQNISAYNNS